MYDANGRLVLWFGNQWGNQEFKVHSELLQNGERIIGYKSRAHPAYEDCAIHCDF